MTSPTPKGFVMDGGGVEMQTRNGGRPSHRRAPDDVGRKIAVVKMALDEPEISARPAILQKTFGWAALYEYWEPETPTAPQPDVQANAGGRHVARAGKARPSSTKQDAERERRDFRENYDASANELFSLLDRIDRQVKARINRETRT